MLVAAFDHRHIFLDPNPDPAVSFAERQRLFALPRSSWDDYDKSLLSEGGGVWSRGVKSIPLSPQVRARLGVDAEQMTPNELINAILKAPVDLLYNGGIGTYVKASSQSQQDANDRTNDAIRIDASELRAQVVGEGGNLGFTQKARIEYAMNGGMIYTDAIDNSAGVGTSDHEVNIKILTSGLLQSGDMTVKQRDALLASMNKITPQDDAKLQHLKAQLLGKIANPINPGNRKVLIFTAFADTADYLYANLAPELLATLAIHTAKVTGKGAPQSTIKSKTQKRSYDFQELLTLFSPRSKEKVLIPIPN